MLILTVALFSALISIIAAIAFQVYRRRERRRAMHSLELKPNCLLTRYPLVFISGRRSPFRLFDHWNEIPLYLREHGYDVWEIDALPEKGRTDAILKAMDELPSSQCHLICDYSSLDELENLARSKHSKIASLTCVRNSKTRVQTKPVVPTPEDLKPLDNAIEYLDIKPTEPRQLNWRTLMAGFCLFIHNRVFLDRSRRIDPIETAEFETSFEIASRFLEHAVSLAERDLMSGNIEMGEESCGSQMPIHS